MIVNGDTGYVAVKDGRFIGKDLSSGYPFLTKDLGLAYIVSSANKNSLLDLQKWLKVVYGEDIRNSDTNRPVVTIHRLIFHSDPQFYATLDLIEMCRE